jgi:hypothetical protein
MMGSAEAIGYIPSFIPKSPKPCLRLLEDEESYGAMIEDIKEYIATCHVKNCGKEVIKPVHIQIVNTSDVDSKKTSLKVCLFLVFFL